MEILTYVLEGSLAHKDSMGHQEAVGTERNSAHVRRDRREAQRVQSIRQRTVAFVPDLDRASHDGTRPSYEQIRFDPKEKQNKLKRLAGPTDGDGAARINQDAQVFVAELAKGTEIPYSSGRKSRRVGACDSWRGRSKWRRLAYWRCCRHKRRSSIWR